MTANTTRRATGLSPIVRSRGLRWLLSLTACFALALAQTGAGEPNLTLRITNDTENAIEHLFVRQAGKRLFGGDLLSVYGDLDPEETVSAGLESSYSESLYELMAVDSEDTVYRVDAVRAESDAERNTATITSDDSSDSEAPEMESSSVSASMGTDVYYVYLERIDTQDLGANLSGGDVIPEDGTANIRYIASEADQLGSFILVDDIGGTMRADGPGDR